MSQLTPQGRADFGRKVRGRREPVSSPQCWAAWTRGAASRACVLTQCSRPPDPGRWDRYPYGSRFRDPRPYDHSYWYDADYDLYRKESYAYADRWVVCPLPSRLDRRQSCAHDRPGGCGCVGAPGEPLAS